jgi:hypothetical protein
MAYVEIIDGDGNPYISGQVIELQTNLYSYVLDRKAVMVGRKIKIY